MKTLCRLGLWAGLMGFLAAPPTLAMTISFQPSAQTADVGDFLTVDILALLDTDEIVSAFDFDLSYDSALLTATQVTFGTALGDPDPFAFEVFTDFDLMTAGLVNFAAVSLLSDESLFMRQATLSSIMLATLSFDVVGTGTSLLEFINYGEPGKDIKGAENFSYKAPTLLTASITTNGDIPVPEPSSFLLISVGLAGMFSLGRAMKR